jgi:uncharacterized protein YkwD
MTVKQHLLALLLSVALLAGCYGPEERSVHAEMNKARDGYGLVDLTVSTSLSKYAEQHLKEMAEHGSLYHSSRAQLASLCACEVSEIIAKVPVGEWYGVVWLWLVSPSHRVILLDGDYRVTGIGVVTYGEWAYVTAILR